MVGRDRLPRPVAGPALDAHRAAQGAEVGLGGTHGGCRLRRGQVQQRLQLAQQRSLLHVLLQLAGCWPALLAAAGALAGCRALLPAAASALAGGGGAGDWCVVVGAGGQPAQAVGAAAPERWCQTETCSTQLAKLASAGAAGQASTGVPDRQEGTPCSTHMRAPPPPSSSSSSSSPYSLQWNSLLCARWRRARLDGSLAWESGEGERCCCSWVLDAEAGSTALSLGAAPAGSPAAAAAEGALRDGL